MILFRYGIPHIGRTAATAPSFVRTPPKVFAGMTVVRMLTIRPSARKHVALPAIRTLPGPLLANAKERTIAAMRAALERAGIEFTDDEHQGVLLIKRRK